MCLATYKIFNTQKWKLGQDINSILSGQSSGVLEENPRIIVSTGFAGLQGIILCLLNKYILRSSKQSQDKGTDGGTSEVGV